jgi:rhodanese-related sulfurtransferase
MQKNRFLYIFLLFLLTSVISCGQQATENDITVAELIKEMQNDSTLVILDVRTPQELTGPLGQIEGVINIPVQVLAQNLDQLEKYKNNNIAVICRSGNRSVMATNILLEKGFKAKNVLGGMKAYIEVK